jgi:hypothetical protein
VSLRGYPEGAKWRGYQHDVGSLCGCNPPTLCAIRSA